MDYEAYLNTLPYPHKNAFTTRYWYKAGKLVAQQAGLNEIEALIKSYPLDDCVVENVIDEKSMKAAQTAYHDETARLTHQFKLDFFAELSIENHPKREKLYSKAWEQGHSAGFSEIMNVGWDLVELIQD
jgi:hypothetical protein